MLKAKIHFTCIPYATKLAHNHLLIAQLQSKIAKPFDLWKSKEPMTLVLY